MKPGVAPEDVIYEHLLHNRYFPETAYRFEGIGEDHFKSVTVRRDGLEVSISSRNEVESKDIKKDMQNHKILHISEKMSSGSEWYLTKAPTGSEGPDLVPPSDNSSGSKGSESQAIGQTPAEKKLALSKAALKKQISPIALR